MSQLKILDDLWQQYVRYNPHAQEIHDLFAYNNTVINDHIALRTINDPRINIDILAQPFIEKGYYENGEYHFEAKKLYAKHYQHKDVNKPKIFISQLLLEQFNQFTQDTINTALDQIPQELLKNPTKLLTAGACWQTPSYHTYQRLLEASEYAAWFYVFGFRANHFTVFVNALNQFDEIADVNAFLKEKGYTLNSAGGEIKGTPKDLLEQSSTKSGTTEVTFTEGTYQVPCCYYEFAKRYPDKNGQLYQGFVAASADKIFESTNVKA
ncbi:DUF1338 domain-containing protein [Facilibium subflavum]|uniref:DUF1338 domain-containing protein n=1 Tax=Facilibium subflavum TaxID=2219058 RepID=UPI000E653935|nr:DUF1338 domain-containing protein [Facilibium subflavum]